MTIKPTLVATLDLKADTCMCCNWSEWVKFTTDLYIFVFLLSDLSISVCGC